MKQDITKMMTIMIEKQILQGLTQDEEYVRQVLPFLKEDYFTIGFVVLEGNHLTM